MTIFTNIAWFSPETGSKICHFAQTNKKSIPFSKKINKSQTKFLCVGNGQPALSQLRHGHAVLPLAVAAGSEGLDIAAALETGAHGGLRTAPVPLPWMMVTVSSLPIMAVSKKRSSTEMASVGHHAPQVDLRLGTAAVRRVCCVPGGTIFRASRWVLVSPSTTRYTSSCLAEIVHECPRCSCSEPVLVHRQ